LTVDVDESVHQHTTTTNGSQKGTAGDGGAMPLPTTSLIASHLYDWLVVQPGRLLCGWYSYVVLNKNHQQQAAITRRSLWDLLLWR
jgi:hypothetical protein